MPSITAEVGADGIWTVQIQGEVGSPECAQELAQFVFGLNRRFFASRPGLITLDLARATLNAQGVLVLENVWCEALTKRYDVQLGHLNPAFVALFKGPGIAPLLLRTVKSEGGIVIASDRTS